MMMFSTPKAKPMMAYSSLTAASPATLPSNKSLLTYLSVLDEEESSSESGSPSSCILLDESSRSNDGIHNSSSRSNSKKDDMLQKEDDLLGINISSSTTNTPHRQHHQQQRRTTDFFRRPVCSLQALSRSAKKKTTSSSRMTFTSPNILRVGGRMNHKQRAHTERANKKKSSRRNSSSVGAGGDTTAQKMELTNVKLEMMSMHLQSKNEEVTNLKALLSQSQSKVELLESKVSTLEEELNQMQLQQLQEQQHLNVPSSILEVQSLGSNSEYDTEHDSQTMSDIPEEILKQLHDAQAREVAVLNHCDVLEDQVEWWQREANEWKRRYELSMEQQQQEEEKEVESGSEESAIVDTSINISFSNDDNGSQGSPFLERHSHSCSITDSVSDNMSMSDENKSPRLDDENCSNNETSSPAAVAKDCRTSSRTPLGNSAIQNNLLTPVVNLTTKKRGGNRRHRKKTKYYSPSTIINKAKGVTSSSRQSSHSGTTTTTNNISSSNDVQFGDVGWKFRKWFGSRYGNYDGLVKEICPDGTRHCVYEADPEGDEFLTLEELEKTKSLMKEAVSAVVDTTATSNINMESSRNVKGDEEGVLQVKKNVTCHIW